MIKTEIPMIKTEVDKKTLLSYLKQYPVRKKISEDCWELDTKEKAYVSLPIKLKKEGGKWFILEGWEKE